MWFGVGVLVMLVLGMISCLDLSQLHLPVFFLRHLFMALECFDMESSYELCLSQWLTAMRLDSQGASAAQCCMK